MTPAERAETIYMAAMEASHKFDSFILAATLAVCGYLAQTTTFGRLGYNVETLNLIILCCFSAAAFFGFRRIEYLLVCIRLNYHILETPASAPKKRQQVNDVMKKKQELTKRYYQYRNGCLYGGFIGYVAIKVFAAYVVV